MPLFDGGAKVMVQRGAGMAVTKGTPETEYASLVFLKWFTEMQKNIEFASLSGGYLPVKKGAMNYDTIKTKSSEAGIDFNVITEDTLKIAIDGINQSELYTTKAFDGGIEARGILDVCLQDKAVADRESVLDMVENGSTLEQAVANFDTEENFKSWLSDLTNKLNEAAK